MAALTSSPLRLLRHEVEALVREKSGKDHLHKKKLEKELADINKETRKLKTRLKAIERRRAELIAEIRYRDAHRSYLPDGHTWWLRDKQERIVPGWDEGGYLCLDFHNPKFRSQVAAQAKLVVEFGAADGVMLDWWSDDPNRLELIREVRQAVGERAIIIAHANDRQTPQTAPYINGNFMECYRSQTANDWKIIADTLAWAETHLREPRVNCLETWFHKSRDDLDLMRATTTLVLTHSGGYCLFSDPNPLSSASSLARQVC